MTLTQITEHSLTKTNSEPINFDGEGRSGSPQQRGSICWGNPSIAHAHSRILSHEDGTGLLTLKVRGKKIVFLYLLLIMRINMAQSTRR